MLYCTSWGGGGGGNCTYGTYVVPPVAEEVNIQCGFNFVLPSILP